MVTLIYVNMGLRNQEHVALHISSTIDIFSILPLSGNDHPL